MAAFSSRSTMRATVWSCRRPPRRVGTTKSSRARTVATCSRACWVRRTANVVELTLPEGPIMTYDVRDLVWMARVVWASR